MAFTKRETKLARVRRQQELETAEINAPPIRIDPSGGGLSLGLKEMWAYRELTYFLIWRDIKIRYKQTAIGASWAVLQPLLTMVVFTLVFNKFAEVPSDGLPYPLFAFTALLPWSFFAGALTRCSASVVSQSNLISKVYFPRLILPISAAVSGIVDFAIAFFILIIMMIWYGVAPNWGILLLPVFLFLGLLTSLSVGFWLASLNVRYRDIGHAVPFLVQIWMFASPVAYSVSLVTAKWQNWHVLYSLNPMVGVIEGFRWALLGQPHPPFYLMLSSAAIVAAFFVGGIIFFKRTEEDFADVV